MKIAELIVNESYWNLFENKEFRTQSQMIPELNILIEDKISIAEYTRNLCSLLQDRDKNRLSLYGIEIKTNGSSRSGRIPLVRYTKSNQSIWKVVYKLKDVDKAIADLNTLIYYLKNGRVNPKQNLPIKVLVVNFKESEYLEKEDLKEYVKQQVIDNDIVWISSAFIASLFRKEERVDLDLIASKSKSIHTKESFI